MKISVSKTNYNRYHYGTHSMVDILHREGYQIDRLASGPVGIVTEEDKAVAFEQIELRARPKIYTVKAVAEKPDDEEPAD